MCIVTFYFSNSRRKITANGKGLVKNWNLKTVSPNQS